MKYLLLSALIGLGAHAFAADSSSKTEAVAPASNEIKVGVKGMVCAFCAQGIEKKFKAQKEIESVQVSIENKFVKLKFKEGKRLTNERIGALLKEAGYEADFGG